MRDFSKGVRKVTILFLFCFVGLIGYISYFQVFKAPKFSEIGASVKSPDSRETEKMDNVLRGPIYDVDGNVLAESIRKENGSQDRVYPYSTLYGAVIGYYDLNAGSNGAERELNKYLAEEDKSKNPKGISLNAYFENKKLEKKANGVITTLDTDLQKVADEAMDNAVYNSEGYNLKGFNGSVVAMNPKTGELYVLLSKPGYDANDIGEFLKMINDSNTEKGLAIDKTTRWLYPPGSVFKTLTLATAIEKTPGVVDRKFKDPGCLDFTTMYSDGSEADTEQNDTSDHYILYNYDSNPPNPLKAWNEDGNGNVSLKYAYQYSSNVVFARLGVEIGEVDMKDAAEKYGFNQPMEGLGIYATTSNFPLVSSYGDIGQASIGQHEVTVTPLQMAMVGCAVVNDGTLMTPKLIKAKTDSEGKVIEEIKPQEMVKGIISPETSAEVRDIMKNVVDKNQVNPIYPAFHGFQGTNAGGKTGTADWVDPETGEVSDDPHAWFLAAAPMDDPEIVVAVVCENGHGGAQSAASVAASVISAYTDKYINK